jgi:hypothetical protein
LRALAQFPTHGYHRIFGFQTSKFIRFLLRVPSFSESHESKTAGFCSFHEIITQPIDSSVNAEGIMMKLMGNRVLSHKKIQPLQKREQCVNSSEIMACSYHSKMSATEIIIERIKQKGGGISKNNETGGLRHWQWQTLLGQV